MSRDQYYWSFSSEPGVEAYNIIDPRTGEPYPYVKSIDTNLGILEEVVFDGLMGNGRPRPVMKYGKVVTRTRMVPFWIIEKSTGRCVCMVIK